MTTSSTRKSWSRNFCGIMEHMFGPETLVACLPPLNPASFHSYRAQGLAGPRALGRHTHLLTTLGSIDKIWPGVCDTGCTTGCNTTSARVRAGPRGIVGNVNGGEIRDMLHVHTTSSSSSSSTAAGLQEARKGAWRRHEEDMEGGRELRSKGGRRGMDSWSHGRARGCTASLGRLVGVDGRSDGLRYLTLQWPMDHDMHDATVRRPASCQAVRQP